MENQRWLSSARLVAGSVAAAAAVAVVIIRLETGRPADPHSTSRGGRPYAEATGSVARRMAPEVALQDLSGNLVKLSEYRGKAVILNFWATWCLPCRIEIPSFVKLREKYRARGLEVIGVSVDEEAGPVRSFVKTTLISYPVAMANPETIQSYGPIDAVPTTFIIDREGRLYQTHRGMVTFNELESAVKGIL